LIFSLPAQGATGEWDPDLLMLPAMKQAVESVAYGIPECWPNCRRYTVDTTFEQALRAAVTAACRCLAGQPPVGGKHPAATWRMKTAQQV
jgi:hypothetical protein